MRYGGGGDVLQTTNWAFDAGGVCCVVQTADAHCGALGMSLRSGTDRVGGASFVCVHSHRTLRLACQVPRRVARTITSPTRPTRHNRGIFAGQGRKAAPAPVFPPLPPSPPLPIWLPGAFLCCHCLVTGGSGTHPAGPRQDARASGNELAVERRILIIDDDRSLCDVLGVELKLRGFHVVTTTSADDALGRLLDEDFSLVLTDVNMQGMSGVELCKQIVENREDLPVVVMTAFGSMETAVAAIRAGAYDFITKPFEIDDLALTIERAVKHRALREEVRRLRRVVFNQQTFDDILGTSSAMRKMYDLVARVAETETTVLITGESGTGKELVAKAIHQRSGREGSFVAINCAAMPETLLEAELFGHVKGAFTDARNARPGLFIKAGKGTLFLDEIGEMPPGMQAKLLRALQERTVRPVGGDQEQPFAARIVAATNRDLETEVEEKRFPRGPVLSNQRRPYPRAPSESAGQRCASPRTALSRALSAERRAPHIGHKERGGGQAAVLLLARQRTRAAELPGARGGAGSVRPDRRRRSPRTGARIQVLTRRAGEW